MQHTPMTEEDCQSSKFMLLKDGDGSFIIEEASVAVAKTSGRQYIKVKLTVTDTEGKTGSIFHNCVLPFHLRHLCYSVKKGHIYEAPVILPAGLIGGRGALKMKQSEYTNSAGERLKSMDVIDYIVNEIDDDMPEFA